MPPRKKRVPRRIEDLEDLVCEDDIENEETVDIAFIPDYHSDSSSNSNSDSEEVNHRTLLPYVDYEHVLSTYTSKQKLLESDHEYDWKDGSSETTDFVENDTIDDTFREIISKKNVLELFELLFHSI